MGTRCFNAGNALIWWILQVRLGRQLARKALKYKGSLGPGEM